MALAGAPAVTQAVALHPECRDLDAFLTLARKHGQSRKTSPQAHFLLSVWWDDGISMCLQIDV